MNMRLRDIDPVPTSHVVLTRFANRREPGAPLPDNDWLAKRCDLFERYCLPSMRAQSLADFAWALFVDPEIGGEARQRLDRYQADFSALRVFPTRHFQDTEAFSAAARSLARSGSQRLITTRTDSDDIVSIDHLERVRVAASCVPGDETAVLVFTSGFELSASRLYWRPFPRSPFSSLVEPLLPSQPPRTIMAAEHESVDSLAHVVELGSPAAWTQVVHGGNILNRVRGIRVPNSLLAEKFVILDPESVHPDSFIGLLVGVPASAIRLTADVLGNRRNLKKVGDLLMRRH